MVEVAHHAVGLASATVVQREADHGCAVSVIRDTNEMFTRHGRMIVIEDIILTSPLTLAYLMSNTSVSPRCLASPHGLCRDGCSVCPTTIDSTPISSGGPLLGVDLMARPVGKTRLAGAGLCGVSG